MNDLDVLGPVDYLVVEFPADKANFSGEIADELKDLVERGVVRVLDLILLRKDADGSVEALELHEFDDSARRRAARVRERCSNAARRGGRRGDRPGTRAG